MFLEAPTAAGWSRARRWRLLPSGGICFAESYDLLVADERDFPHAKPWADAVACAFGIEVDEVGAVVEDDLVETDRGSLRLALATALYHDPARDRLGRDPGPLLAGRRRPGLTQVESSVFGLVRSCPSGLSPARREYPNRVETTATVVAGG